MDTILLLASIAYAIAATAYYLAGARSRRSPDTLRVARAAILVGVLLHLCDVVLGSIKVHHCPVTSTQFAASMTGLTTVVVFLTLASRARIEPLGALVAPIGLVSLITSEFMHGSAAGTEPAKLWLAVHVTSNVVGVGLFLVSAGVSAAYLAQAARLKTKRAGNRQLPGLLPLELLMRRLLLIGFVPLSLGVITGAAFANRVRLGGLDAMRIVFAYGVWLLAGIMVFGGRVAGWHGRKIAIGNIVGALVSVLVVIMYVLSPSLVAGGR